MISSLNIELQKVTDKTSTKAKKLYHDIDILETDLSERRIDLYNKSDEIRLKAARIYREYEKKRINEATAAERAAIYQNQAEELKSFRKRYQKKQQEAAIFAKKEADLKILIENESDKSKKAKLKEELKSIQKSAEDANKYLADNKDSYGYTAENIINASMNAADILSKSGNANAALEAIEAAREATKIMGTDAKENQKNLKELDKMQVNALVDKQKKEAQDRKDKQKEDALARKAELKYRLTTLDGIKDAISSGINKAFDAIDQPIKSFYEYQAKYEARLQGSENHYNKMMTEISRQIGMSPFVSQKKMVEKLQKAIDSGVNYNVELRAYIATVTENIASTFDAFDGELLRLIRIQQSDSTAARMGMEAALTQVLNKMFSDSSYLSDASDNVTHALLDASAQLSHDMATEFEFVTQKWLGALYSLGVSSTTVQNIAQTLGYIGSGNVEQLAGNDQMMTLLAMSAAKGGTSISELLTGEFSAKKTNDLLYGMTQLLGEIANNTDSNKVTKSAFANVFGITNTDLKSISNLTANDISTLYDYNLNYSQALVESSMQLKQIAGRTHISQMLNNLIQNTTDSMALTIGGNPATYALYKATSLISNLVGDRGIEIPGIQAMGTGTASGISIIPIMKAGIVGMGLLGPLLGSIANLSSGGLPALDRWAGYEKSLQRGNSLILKDYGVQSGFSSSAQYNNASNQSSDDMTKSAMQSSKESATENMSEEDKAAQDSAKQYQDKMSRLADTIMTLIGENAENSLKVLISNDEKNKIIPVKLADLEGSASDKLRTALESILLTGASLTGDINNTTTPFIELLKSTLSDLTVKVDNDLSNPLYVQQSIIGGI